MDKYGFCKIFVDSMDAESVKARLASALGGQFQRRDMELPGLYLAVLANPDGDVGSADFVRWPLLVEVESADPAVAEPIVDAVGQLLAVLWKSDTPAIAACDFEDELPWSGGIARL